MDVEVLEWMQQASGLEQILSPLRILLQWLSGTQRLLLCPVPDPVFCWAPRPQRTIFPEHNFASAAGGCSLTS
jgi:hypothetical protein